MERARGRACELSGVRGWDEVPEDRFRHENPAVRDAGRVLEGNCIGRQEIHGAPPASVFDCLRTLPHRLMRFAYNIGLYCQKGVIGSIALFATCPYAYGSPAKVSQI